MRVVPALAWMIAGEPPAALDPRLLPLLQAIDGTGSLAAAIGRCGFSYRAAWGLLKAEERRLGASLVVLERGRGAALAPAGAKLVSAQRSAEQRLSRTLPALGVELGRADGSDVRDLGRLKIVASHDPVLAALRDELPAAAGISLDLAFMGSLHALEQFAADQTDLAGFHIPSSPRALVDPTPFRRLLRPGRDRLIRFVERDQGFILSRANAKRVRSFADLAERRLRFVNRQRGSGTRLVVDRLLVAEGVETSAVIGYGHEEFTHAAVAATIASGAADAGFGVRAGAAEHGLAFVPRVRERYYLAVRAKTLSSPAVQAFIESLKGPLFGRIVRRLPGYRRTGAGTVFAVQDLA